MERECEEEKLVLRAGYTMYTLNMKIMFTEVITNAKIIEILFQMYFPVATCI